MDIKSKLLGAQSVDPDTVITFPHGLPGFENDTRFKFFHQEGSDIVYWLQSLDNEEVLFSVAHPAQFNINYNFTLTDAEEALLKLDNVDDLIIMMLLHKSDDESAQPTIKGSIQAPLVINGKTRIAIQKSLPKVEQSITLTETSNEIDVSES
ncbi:MAG: flagellar biosynthesis protein FliW [Methyloprofundus sp.]|nr:flagellar biosynthesis protein FliW [Methyloprofundus sp.]